MQAIIDRSEHVFEVEPDSQTRTYSVETWRQDFQDPGGFFEFDKESVGARPQLVLPGLKRFLAISRYNPWWVTPRLGSHCREVDRETLCLLWEDRRGLHHVLFPLLDGELRASLIGDEAGLRLFAKGPLESHPRDAAQLLYAASGEDPLQLMSDAMAKVAARLGTFIPRTEKSQPAYADLLGWCTWDAFYQEVSEEGVLAGLESFRASGMVPPLLILDDGWQDSSDQTLLSFRAHPKKFPHGLKSLVKRSKEEFGVKVFGVWHALQGYWGGVHPDGEVAKAYPIISNTGALFPNWDKWAERERFLVHPASASRMFADWYAELRNQGVDMVKVDSQASHSVFLDSNASLVGAMRDYHSAVVTEASRHFCGNLLNCMSNTLDIAYQSGASVMWRNSEDYSPNRPAFHQEHLWMNVMNNVWSGTFSWPDWDMFQSHDNDAEFLAASRAISGSPIYVSDKPGMSNVSLLKKLCTSGGRALRCPQPALPAREILFVDCHREPVALKIVNRNAAIGFIGLFHCFAQDKQPSALPLTGNYSPSDVPDLAGENFAAWHYQTQKLQILEKDARADLQLGRMGFELITLSPIVNGFGPIGLLEKFNPGAAIEGYTYRHQRWTVLLRDGGRVGFYSRTAPQRIALGSSEVEFSYDEETGLLECSVPEGGPLSLIVQLS